MTNPSPAQKKKTWYRVGIAIWILVMLAIYSLLDIKVTTDPVENISRTDTPQPALFQYKTISIPDSTNQLLGYEFQAWKNDYYGDYSCCAIIKKIDPAKENYKLYSRAIVADIINTIGSSDIEVTIYDDYQAYTLAELNTGRQFKMLTKIEDDSINNHTIATYHARSGGWCDNTRTISFYAQAGNNYTANEPYQ